MASTYSALKLQLMTTGENLNTWGTVTNTNLGTALEEAIVGSADVTFSSGNVSLSLSNTNATQTARNMRLNLTGTTGGSTRTLTVPDIEKVYIVNNGCADAVAVGNSTGSTVTVPAGKTMWVYSTGTNVVDVVTHLTSVTLGSALPVASGGTGANTAANARTALGLTIGTDVLAPNGVGSALTALNASSISSGTLGTAYGGTGAATLDGLAFSGANITALNASALSSGTVGTARLASGTANNTTYLRGDQTWASLNISSLFPATLSSTGYQELPNGLIINWGFGTGGVTFSKTFPTAFLCAVVATNTSSPSNVESTWYNGSTTGLTIQSLGGHQCSYIAIGY